MKKLIVLSMMILFTFACFSQMNDTIYYKNGDVVPVHKINKVDRGTLWYIKTLGAGEWGIDTALISGYLTNWDKKTMRANYENRIIDKNLLGFYKEQRISQLLSGVGILTSFLYLAKPTQNTAILYLSSGIGLAGLVFYLDSYKWIKRASLRPDSQGLTLKVEF